MMIKNNDKVYNNEIELNNSIFKKEEIIGGEKKMDMDNTEKIAKSNKEIIHATTPDSELRRVVFDVLDIDNDGDIDLADWKLIIKFLAKWFAFIIGVIMALRDGGTIDIFSISGWTTIIGVVLSTAYQIFKRKKDAEGFLKVIYKYRDLLLQFIDLINKIIHKTEEQDIMVMTQEFLVKVKDTIAREEIKKN